MLFISSSKFFLFLRYFNFHADYFNHPEKRLVKTAKANHKIYDAINWETNNYNTHIARKLKM